MFFILSKILAPFTQPFTYIVLSLVTALALYRVPKIGRGSLLAAVLLVALFGTPFLPDLLIRRLERAYTPPAAPSQVDAVIVLAGMLDVQQSSEEYLEFGEAVERILTGMRLVREGVGDKLVIVGGSGDLFNQTKRESVFLRQFAIDFGIPANSILIDPDSRNTYENAVNARKIMEEHGLRSSILITSALHMPRSMGCFRSVGLEPIAYPVDFISDDEGYRFSAIIPDVGHIDHMTRAFHEYFGLLAYKIAGYL